MRLLAQEMEPWTVMRRQQHIEQTHISTVVDTRSERDVIPSSLVGINVGRLTGIPDILFPFGEHKPVAIYILDRL